jgi:hypothetical protein
MFAITTLSVTAAARVIRCIRFRCRRAQSATIRACSRSVNRPADVPFQMTSATT